MNHKLRDLNAVAVRGFTRRYNVIFILALAVFTFLDPRLSNGLRALYGANHETSRSSSVFFSKVSFEIEGIKLVDFLNDCAQTYGFSFFLDRRVDPSTLVAGSYSNEPLFEVLDDLLGASQLSFFIVDNSCLLYIGPKDAAGEALLLLGQKNDGIGLEKAPKQAVARLFDPIDFHIKPYSEPNEVFQSFAQRSHLKLSGFEKSPFDLYRDTRFDSINAGSILTILGLGFNVDYRYDETTSSFKPVSIDKNAAISRRYPEDFLNNFKKEDFPDCKFENRVADGKNNIYVSGPFKSVAQIELYASRNSRNYSETEQTNANHVKKHSANGSVNQTRITGEVDGVTLRTLFAYLESNANVSCQLDADLKTDGITLESRISCKFKNADIKQIGSIVAKQINANPDIKGNTITFRKSNTFQ